jgi:hypothetical protein
MTMQLNETMLEVGVKKIQSRTLKCILFSIFLPMAQPLKP